MSGIGRVKPNLVFRLSPVKAFHDDRIQRLVTAKLDITGAILHSGGETSMQTYFEYDYIAISGRPVRKRKKRLKENKLRKQCTIKVEITNYEIKPDKLWDLIFTVSSRSGSRKRSTSKKFPYLQIFKTQEPVVEVFRDEQHKPTGEIKTHKKHMYPLKRRTNDNKALMKETSRRKKMKKLRHFYTKIHDNPDDPLRIFIPQQKFYHEPAPADAEEKEREKITYTLRLAGRRRHYDHILFFHSVNMFILDEDTRSRLEARLAELEAELEVRQDVSTREDQILVERFDQFERLIELRIEDKINEELVRRSREARQLEQRALVDEAQRLAPETEISRRRRGREERD